MLIVISQKFNFNNYKFFLLKKYSNTKIALRETYLLQFKREDSKKVWVVYDH